MLVLVEACDVVGAICPQRHVEILRLKGIVYVKEGCRRAGAIASHIYIGVESVNP